VCASRLPIALELRSRRSKASVASSQAANNSSSSLQYRRPEALQSNTHTGNITSCSDNNAPISYKPVNREDSIRKRAQSNPMRISSSPSPSLTDLPIPSHSALDNPLERQVSISSKKVRRAGNVSPVSYEPPSTPPVNSASSLKARNKVNSSTINASARKPSNAAGSSGGSRRPLHASSSTSNRQASTPIKKSPSRSTPPSASSRTRSSSTSLLHRASLYDWDENSKPPWLDEEPTYLYKSDIEGVAAGSLVDIARHAQGRADTSFNASNGGDTSADMSTRSWDDVILPAVAKQIRAKQMMEAQKASSARNTGKQDEDMLVTDWDANGTPRKWQKVERNQQQKTHQLGTRSGEASDVQDVPSSLEGSVRVSQQGLSYDDVGDPSERQRTHSSRTENYRQTPDSHYQPGSSNENTTSAAQHLQSLPQGGSEDIQRRPSYHTGRKEVWDNPSLRSPTTALQNGFISQRHTPSRNRLESAGVQEMVEASTWAQDTPVVNVNQETVKDGEEDTHGSKCCKCIIM
jgi:hypothetical protein